jgi:hypothetical protein
MVLIQRSVPNHLIHAIVTLFTCGFWVFVWIVASLRHSPWRCTFCGGSSFGQPSYGYGHPPHGGQQFPQQQSYPQQIEPSRKT